MAKSKSAKADKPTDKPTDKPKDKPKDQHKSGFLVRLPEVYRELLQKLKQKTDRPITASVRRGVDKELKENGIEPPSGST